MPKKKPSYSKRKIVSIIAGTIIVGSSFFVLKSGNHKILLPAYQSIEVYDGDTFLTKDHRKIRLASVDAPEKGNCGYQEAKEQLEKLIKNKPLYIKVVYVDNGYRLISYVYTTKGSVNAQLLKSGWARIVKRNDSEKNKATEATDYAQKHNLGIFSSKCLSKKPDKPNCLIKGNISKERKTKIYSYPGCAAYAQIFVQKDKGDSWFCTEAQAKKAGFTRSGSCVKNME